MRLLRHYFGQAGKEYIAHNLGANWKVVALDSMQGRLR
jgi:hypothetical protein